MKKTQEFSGKDVDTAVKTACSALSVSKKELKYEVISAGASGIFGIVGRKDAVIKVLLPQNKTTTSEEDLEGIRSMVDEAFGQDTRITESASGKKTGRSGDDAPEKTTSKEPKNKPSPEKKAAPAAPVESKPHKPLEKPARMDSQPPASDAVATDTPPPEPPADLPPVVDVTQESIDLGMQTLQKMADLITEDATVEPQSDRDHLTLKISGGNAGILIGRKGQTLDAMQFLTDKIINRKSEARVRVKVDVEGYTETRKSNLRHLAVKMAEKAKKTGRPATINQMSAQDRRIVHLALKDDNRVRTQSMGDGYYRRLVIFPKKKNSFAGKKRFKR
ncbi:MAG: Jag N-terminal domain-containing protein [Desulfotignum sp.]|nr:Jag N-terminal domain-containing protein [Desulfotignum sp.]MCF8125801.1 Jag N-terminal domain-containing protein [Desulfotignum sp.]